MQILIESRDTQKGQGYATAERRIRFAMRRMASRVRTARASFVDVNGPRGGKDMQCQLELRTNAMGVIVTTATARNGAHALDGALQKAVQALVRSNKRKTNHGRESLRRAFTVLDADEPVAAS